MESPTPSLRGEWPLPDTVKPYCRHVFVCTGERSWPARIEEAGGLLGRMASDVRALRESTASPPKLTATDDPTRGPGRDLLVFPEAVRYLGVDEASWPTILRDHVVGGQLSRAAPSTPLAGDHVFVCVHRASDERCGSCGPRVLQALEEACAAEGLEDVTVRATSHVGGHKYAGNVLVYPEGVWYGYVRPEDAPRIIRDHIQGRRVVEELCRGRMEPI
jgi:(2Fe-2S) ferredoxin